MTHDGLRKVQAQAGWGWGGWSSYRFMCTVHLSLMFAPVPLGSSSPITERVRRGHGELWTTNALRASRTNYVSLALCTDQTGLTRLTPRWWCRQRTGCCCCWWWLSGVWEFQVDSNTHTQINDVHTCTVTYHGAHEGNMTFTLIFSRNIL